MIKDLKNNSRDNILAAAVAYVMVFALTFQQYFAKFISPETPFFKIGTIPFQHIEFVAIVFVLAAMVGVLVSIFILKAKMSKLVSIFVVLLGFISIFIGMFSVDFLQKLMPTMRISHVIMTVSRLNGIILAASGFFVGLLLHVVAGQYKRVFYAMVIALILSVFAYSLNAFNVIYIVLGVAIVLLAIVYGFIGVNKETVVMEQAETALSTKIIGYISAVFKGGIITFFFVYGYYYFINTFAVSAVAFAVTAVACGLIWFLFSRLVLPVYAKIACGFIAITIFIANACVPMVSLLIVALLIGSVFIGMCNDSKSNKERVDKQTLLCGLTGALIFAILAMVFNHYVSNVIVYSQNRIVYEPSVLGTLILLALIIAIEVIECLKMFINKRLKKNINNTQNS